MVRRPPRSTLDRSSAASDVYKRQAPGRVAQLVEQGIENPRVGGSIPSPATIDSKILWSPRLMRSGLGKRRRRSRYTALCRASDALAEQSPGATSAPTGVLDSAPRQSTTTVRLH